jgi:predicted transcriptional regulator
MSVKTTIYMPEDLKKALAAEARRRGQSEAEVVRDAIRALVARPRPRSGIIEAEPFAAWSEELLSGFGER